MNDKPELVTVFRSADSSAEEDAENVYDLLVESGLSPVVLRDDAIGVPSGTCEVRVPSEQAKQADELITASAESKPEPGDPSHDLDVETIFDAIGATAEMEAIGIRSVLEANGIPVVMIGPSVYPNLRFLVRVSKKDAARAQQVLDEARAAGPAAADEAQMEGDDPVPD